MMLISEGKTLSETDSGGKSAAGRSARKSLAALACFIVCLAVLLAATAKTEAGGGQTPLRRPTGRQQMLQQMSRRRQAKAPPQPTTSPAQPSGQAAQPSGQQAQPAASARSGVGFRLDNADLLQFISLVAAQLKINYVVDPTVKGSVTINTAGDLRTEDLLPILETVLRINGATAVQTGNFYRIMPLKQAAGSPLQVLADSSGKNLSTDDRMVMEIIPLRFVLASDMSKMLTPFLSEGGTVAVHEGGNVLIAADNSLNMKRLLDILEQFDSPAFAQQRVRLVSVHNNVASALVPELESIFSAYALNAKDSPLRFLPLDRINAILAVAADPSAFDEVEKWVTKLDQPAAPSGIQTFVYQVQNSEATYLAQLLTRIRGGAATAGATQPQEGTGRGAGTEGAVGAEMGMAGGGGGRRGGGGSTALGGRFSTAGRGGAFGGASANGLGGGSGFTSMGGAGFGGGGFGTSGELGLGMESGAGETLVGGARIITDPVNNALIVESTAADYAEIAKTLKELDVLPRQVLIEARVYEVNLTGDLSFGVEYFLQQRTSKTKNLLGSFSAANALQASAGAYIGQSRELMAFLNASENHSRIRVLSAPSILATDNTSAIIQVGSSVPILTSQAVVGGVQVGSNTVFSNTVENVDTGIILRVKPRITSTGLVSLEISQEISNAQPVPATGIQSPSFSKRAIQTHTVVKDGDTIALGGLISYNVTTSRNRIPLLGDIPGLGLLFGSSSYSRQETELIVLLSPRIISTEKDARDATKELRDKVQDLRNAFRKEKAMNP
jgi:general secretion pathway protein D